jgi:hypothetical protein
MTENMIGRLTYSGEIRKYVLGGNATFTLVLENGTRFTYNVKSTKVDREKNWSTGNQDKTGYFVSVLTGSDIYAYIGMMKLDPLVGEYNFDVTHKSQDWKQRPAFYQFQMFWNLLERGCRVSPDIEFWHEGSCCMCGRKLTVPSSIEAGIGPECAGKE